MALRRILLVEDSSTMRRMLSTMLREDRFEVDTANDGREGLAKARGTPSRLDPDRLRDAGARRGRSL